jgi:hypothetical protein
MHLMVIVPTFQGIKSGYVPEEIFRVIPIVFHTINAGLICEAKTIECCWLDRMYR